MSTTCTELTKYACYSEEFIYFYSPTQPRDSEQLSRWFNGCYSQINYEKDFWFLSIINLTIVYSHLSWVGIKVHSSHPQFSSKHPQLDRKWEGWTKVIVSRMKILEKSVPQQGKSNMNTFFSSPESSDNWFTVFSTRYMHLPPISFAFNSACLSAKCKRTLPLSFCWINLVNSYTDANAKVIKYLLTLP